MNKLSCIVSLAKFLVCCILSKDEKIPYNVDVLFFCHDSDRGLQLEGKAYSPLIDSVRELFEQKNLKCAVVAHPCSVLVGDKSHGNVVSANREYLFSHVKKIVSSIFKIDKTNDYVALYYIKILRIASPKVVITIGSPNSLCKACRDLSIKHAELLHGIGYTEVEWGWDRRSSDELPSYVISLDSISTSTFKQLESKNVKIFEVAHPFLRRFLDPNLYADIPKEWKIFDISKRKKILVLLQWGYGGEYSQYDNIVKNSLYPEILEEVIQKTQNDIDWCFRFHPVQVRDSRYRQHLCLVSDLAKKFRNVEWKRWTDLPLPAILKHVDGCISMSSMAVYEAAIFGVKSFLMCPTVRKGGINQYLFEDLVCAGYVIKDNPTMDVLNNWVAGVSREDSFYSEIYSENKIEDIILFSMLDK